MSRKLLAPVLVGALVSAGCFELFNTVTKPSPTIQVLGGTWTSESPTSTTLLNNCSNFQWTLTQQSTGQAAGTFSATCFGVLAVTGSLQATFSGTTINWTANGTANGAGITNCAISLSGTGTLGATDLVVSYTGTTCQGAVSGTETLKRA